MAKKTVSTAPEKPQGISVSALRQSLSRVKAKLPATAITTHPEPPEIESTQAPIVAEADDFCLDSFAREYDQAMANPEEVPEDDYSFLYDEPEIEQPEALPIDELASSHPDLAQVISAFNSDSVLLDEEPVASTEDETVSSFELDALMSGLDAALEMALSPEEPEAPTLQGGSVEEMAASIDASVLTPDQIAALVAASHSAPEAIEEPIEEPSAPADENEMMSDDDIAALLAAQAPAPTPAPAADENEMMSDDDIAALLAAQTPAPTPAPAADENEMMSDDDIAALLAAQAPAPAPAPADDESMMSDDDIAALLMAAEQSAVEITSQPEPHAEIDQLVEKASGPKGGILSMDDLTSLLENNDATPEVGMMMGDAELHRLMADAEKAANAPIAEPEPIAFTHPDPIETQVEVQAEAKPQLTVVPTETALWQPEPDALALVPAPLAIAALAVPLRVEGETLIILAAEPFDKAGLERIGKRAGKILIPQKATISDVIPLLREAYQGSQATALREEVWDAGAVKPKLLDRITSLWRKSS